MANSSIDKNGRIQAIFFGAHVFCHVILYVLRVEYLHLVCDWSPIALFDVAVAVGEQKFFQIVDLRL